MRCGGNCTCNRHGNVPEELFYICAGKLNYPPNHKGVCMERIRKVLDEHIKYKTERQQAVISEAISVFKDYEMCVDDYPTIAHKNFMSKLRDEFLDT